MTLARDYDRENRSKKGHLNTNKPENGLLNLDRLFLSSHISRGRYLGDRWLYPLLNRKKDQRIKSDINRELFERINESMTGQRYRAINRELFERINESMTGQRYRAINRELFERINELLTVTMNYLSVSMNY